MNYDYRITGQVIRMLRMERTMSQELLSGLVGIERIPLRKIENGYKNASVDSVWKIADTLYMKLRALIGIVEDVIECDTRIKWRDTTSKSEFFI